MTSEMEIFNYAQPRQPSGSQTWRDEGGHASRGAGERCSLGVTSTAYRGDSPNSKAQREAGSQETLGRAVTQRSRLQGEQREWCCNLPL